MRLPSKAVFDGTFFSLATPTLWRGMQDEPIVLIREDLREDLSLPADRGSVQELELLSCVFPVEFPSGWAVGMDRLRKLRIIDCQMKAVPPLHDLVALEELDLRGNQLRFIDLPPLANLRTVDIRNNCVSKMVHIRSLSLQGRLTHLRLADNPIAASSASAGKALRTRLLSQCPSLEQLDGELVRHRVRKAAPTATSSSVQVPLRKPCQTPPPHWQAMTLRVPEWSASPLLDPTAEPLRSLLGSEEKHSQRSCHVRTIERLSRPRSRNRRAPSHHMRRNSYRRDAREVAFGCSVTIPRRLSFPDHPPAGKPLVDDGQPPTDVDLANCRMWCVEAEESLLTLQAAQTLLQRRDADHTPKELVSFLLEKGLDSAIPGPPPPVASQALRAFHAGTHVAGWETQLLFRLDTCMSELRHRFEK